MSWFSKDLAVRSRGDLGARFIPFRASRSSKNLTLRSCTEIFSESQPRSFVNLNRDLKWIPAEIFRESQPRSLVNLKSIYAYLFAFGKKTKYFFKNGAKLVISQSFRRSRFEIYQRSSGKILHRSCSEILPRSRVEINKRSLDVILRISCYEITPRSRVNILHRDLGNIS